MGISRITALISLPFLLAACVPEPPPAPDAPDMCQAAAFQGLVGQPKAILAQMLLPAGTRIIGPNDAVNLDYRNDRLNIEVGANDRIAKVACY